MATLPDLPVRAALAEIARTVIDHGTAVLVAPPGTGKTTLVPPALAEFGKVVVAEPRRLAARAAAARMAALLGEPVGKTVGYAVRGDRKVSKDTRIEVVTSGLLVRRLQSDPELSGVDTVLLDECHERHLDADLLLAMLLDARDGLRPDLRLLATSATVAEARLAALLGDAPVIRVDARTFPVDTRYLPPLRGERIEACAARATRAALSEGDGDVLVFLPGAAEIRRVAAALSDLDADVLPLHGRLANAEQDAALTPGPRRRVVLSTAVAESSLTVPGVRAVVDAGQSRVSRVDHRRGLAGLVTVRVSAAVADQRAGRAGREAPGRVYRCWPEHEHATLPRYPEPEIRTADLTRLALELACWGTPDGGALRWWDAPPAGPLAAGQQTLRALGALDGDTVTERGTAIARLGLHPRIARALLDGAAKVGPRAAAEVVAVLDDDTLVDTADLDSGLRALRSGTPKSARWRREVGRLARLVEPTTQAGRRPDAPSARPPGPEGRTRVQVSALKDKGGEPRARTASAQTTASAEQDMADSDHGARTSSTQAAAEQGKADGDQQTRTTAIQTTATAEYGRADDEQQARTTATQTTATAEYGRADDEQQARTTATQTTATAEYGRADDEQQARTTATQTTATATAKQVQGDSEQRARTASPQPAASVEQERAVGESSGTQNWGRADPALITALAHPERLARRRGKGSRIYLLAGGTAVELPPGSGLGDPEWLAVAVADRAPGHAHGRVRLAARADEELAVAAAPALVSTVDEVVWADGDVRARRVRRLGAIGLHERPLANPPADAVRQALRDGLRKHGLTLVTFSDGARSLRARLDLLHRVLGDPWPAVDDDALLAAADTWLGTARSRADLGRLNLTDALRALLPWPAAARLDELVPERIEVPSGSRVRVDYTGDSPALPVKVQEVFGWTESPTVVDGRVPVVLHLLSPAGRPTAVTGDLKSFWTTGYPQVRADLRGRYPRHRWPEDPTTALPTRHTIQRKDSR
ncbi:ATP-dependent RNA helicase [Alloactinosynnema sp. L-07]|uniref:ATP-dependent RNA helicase n=1 Tax=Alloactinosynnema sp. L-07 TaxID=1653480 RepID=UPI0006B5D9C0|nr:ATP-dependent helicase C-terminal domain-containing protein [Alloactinosynnema sp. L-07]